MAATQEALIDTLYHARRNGTRPARMDPTPANLDEALAVQLRVLQRFETTGERLGGWKVGLTSGKARDRMGKDVRPFGYVLQSRVFQSGATLPVASIMDCQIEPELCLIVGSALRGEGVDREQAKAAVRAVAPAFEINEVRVQSDQGPTPLVADGLAQWGIVVGPEAPVQDGLVNTTVRFRAMAKWSRPRRQAQQWMIPISRWRACADSCIHSVWAWNRANPSLPVHFVITPSRNRGATARIFPASERYR